MGMKDVKKWGTEAFKQEVRRLCDGFLQSCLLWGLTFDFERNNDNDNNEEGIKKAIEFTKKEFSKHHPELSFEKVFGTLFYVATSCEKGVFVVRPEINTIYTYLPDGRKHDLITPIILTLMNECLLMNYISQTTSLN